MHSKKSLYVVVAVVILLVAGFFTYSQLHDKATQKTQQTQKENNQDNNKTDTKDPVVTPENKNESITGETPAKKTPFPETAPDKGELFVEGTVKSIDVEKRILTIVQHMDDNSKNVNPNVPVKKDAIIQTKTSDIAITQIKVGDIVSMIITSEGQARAVMVNF